jgi:hypothetical protein
MGRHGISQRFPGDRSMGRTGGLSNRAPTTPSHTASPFPIRDNLSAKRHHAYGAFPGFRLYSRHEATTGIRVVSIDQWGRGRRAIDYFG